VASPRSSAIGPTHSSGVPETISESANSAVTHDAAPVRPSPASIAALTAAAHSVSSPTASRTGHSRGLLATSAACRRAHARAAARSAETDTLMP
jgi:hypothetical protein